MTPERLLQIEELYHAARQDMGVLADAEAGLRAEVESLLEHESGVLPALTVDTSSMELLPEEANETPVVTGSVVGPYVIADRIGLGGMGVVFRARDTKLERTVAIKFLSGQFVDSNAVRRFQREAQLASSLNHPHILTVHDVGEYDGSPYLVTEFVDGGTLRDWVKADQRTWWQVVELLLGVADGLAAAHGAGILHRDIKPANILVARNGYAKLADFGLARLLDNGLAASQPHGESETRSGLLIGTLQYLSPEAAQGRPVDARSDMFSFGIVLYEMLAGQRPFVSDSDIGLLVSVIHSAPPPLPTELPVELRAIVEKSLEKDPGDRYQTARDFVVDLRHAARRKTEMGPLKPVTWKGRRNSLLSLAAAVFLAAMPIVWLAYRTKPFENPLANATFTRLTDYEGVELDAAISPDGKFVSFLSDRDGHFHAWITEPGVGKPVDLTPGTQDERGPLRTVGFSWDGSEIWLAGTERRQIRMVPLVGGDPRLFLGWKAVNPVWSPDGTRLAYQSLESGDPIFVANRDGSNPQQIFRDKADKHNHYLAWGADGKWIYFVHGTPATTEMDLWRIRAGGGNPERMTLKNADMRDPVMLGAGTILYVARDSDGSGPWIWALDTSSRTSHRITIGLETYTSLAVSGDGRRLAATVANHRTGLWSVPISNAGKDSIAGEEDVRPFSLPSARSLAPRFRGTALYYLSSQGAGDGLWRFQQGKAVEVWKGNDGGLHQAPAISPDGRRIAIVMQQQGKRRVRLITADGTESNPLASELDVEGSPDWSPDGKWIVTGGNDGTGAGLFKIPVAGGKPVRLTNSVGRNPVWSPDGSLIVYSGPNVFALTQMLAVRPDGTPLALPQIRMHRDGEGLRFLPNARGVVYMEGGGGGTPWHDFWLLDLTTLKTRRLTRLNDRAAMHSFDITPDGGQIVFDRLSENASAVLIDLRAAP